MKDLTFDTEKIIHNTLKIATLGFCAEEIINQTIAYIGSTLHSDRCFIFEQIADVTSNTFEWVADGAEPQMDNLQNFPISKLEGWYRSFREGKLIKTPNIEEIKEKEPWIYNTLKAQKIKSIIAMPLIDNHEIIGFYGIDNPPTEFLNQISEMLETLSFFIVSGLRRKKMEAHDYSKLLDAMKITGIFVITEKDHKILYFNDKVKQVFPDIRIGNVCHDIWKSSCSNCPLLYIKENESYTCVSQYLPFGKLVDITATRYLWQNKIPSYIIQVIPHIDSLNEHEVKIRGIYIDVMNDMFFKSVLVDLDTGNYESFYIASHSSEFESYGVYDELLCDQLKFVHESYREEILKNCTLEELKNYFSKGNRKYECVYKTNRTDGFTWLRFIASIFVDKSCEKSYMIAMIENVTDAKEKEMEAERALKAALIQAKAASIAKSTFLSNMSHDIRTPMNAIVGYASIAASHIDEPQRIKDSIQKILVSGEHLQGIINDILDMSRIESGKVVVNLTKGSILNLIRDSLNMIQMQIQAKHQELFVDTIGIKNEIAWMDITKMRQVLVNILANAVKFTDAGGNISVRVVQEKSTQNGYARYVFRIKDNGIGMSQEFKDRIFEAFEQEHTTSSNVVGTGLGMAISKKLVDMMGGTISVESEVGKGCEFIIKLELKVEKDEKTYSQIEDTEEKIFNGENILLVEDNELNTEISVFLLNELGFNVQTAENGKVALDILSSCEEDKFQYVLMDIQMPVMNGLEAAEKIRKLDRKDTKKIPIIAVTANAFKEDEEQCIKAGMNAHLAKPFRKNDLIKVLARVKK